MKALAEIVYAAILIALGVLLWPVTITIGILMWHMQKKDSRDMDEAIEPWSEDE